MNNKQIKPYQMLPEIGVYVLSGMFFFFAAAGLLMGLVTHEYSLIALAAFPAAFGLLLYLLVQYPRVKVSLEGISIQRSAKSLPQLLPWSQFQCVYAIRAGFTYKNVGLLFTTHPLSKPEQFEVAKACQKGAFRPPLVHEGHVWIASIGIPKVLRERMPDSIRIMPEVTCANVNLLFTKLI